MTRYKRMSNEVLAARTEEAFKGAAREACRVPSVDEVIAWDRTEGNVPPLSRSGMYRHIESTSDKESPVAIVDQYLARIGIRSAIFIDDELFDSKDNS